LILNLQQSPGNLAFFSPWLNSYHVSRDCNGSLLTTHCSLFSEEHDKMKNPTTDDPHDLQRFLRAQEPTYATALAELRSGQKRSHWMWFIFPQIEGLGQSPTSKYYAIKSLTEAQAYLQHPVLGPRLRECAEAILAIEDRSAAEIFGFPDDLKLRSSMTLFAALAGADSVFARVLERFYDGRPDGQTLRIVGLQDFTGSPGDSNPRPH